MLSLTVVIPVYNEERTIEKAVKQVLDSPYPSEIIVVDDGSTDRSGEILKRLKKREIPKLKIFFQKNNKGKGSAIQAGIKYASKKYILIQDADLEYSVSDYGRIIAPVTGGIAVVVYGSRFKNRKIKISKASLLANKFLTFLTRLLFGSDISDMECCYKLAPRDLLLSLGLGAKRFEIEPEITAKILKKGYKIYEVPVSYRARSRAQGKKIGARDGVKALVSLLRYRFTSS